MKRRTRKQKLTVHHKSLENLYQDQDAKISLVKGEFKYKASKRSPEAKKQKKADYSPQVLDGKFIKRDIVKSLGLASFVISLELVLYFVWK